MRKSSVSVSTAGLHIPKTPAPDKRARHAAHGYRARVFGSMRADVSGVARRRRGGKRRRLSNRSSLPFLAVLAGLGWLSHQPRLILPVLVIAAGVATTALVWYARRGFIAKRRYRDLSRLKLLSPLDFERHVAEYYRRNGFRVTLTKQSGDQGIDVIADGKGGRVGIQVKRYLNGVGNRAVQEVVAGLSFHGCSRGVVITTGRFTASARALAAANHVELIDGAMYVSHVTRQLGIVNG